MNILVIKIFHEFDLFLETFNYKAYRSNGQGSVSQNFSIEILFQYNS